MKPTSRKIAFPALVSRDRCGRYLVQFPDLPEALTDGATKEEALTEAADCLREALSVRIRNGENIPVPSAAQPGMYRVAPLPQRR